jgi:hypothetical protein
VLVGSNVYLSNISDIEGALEMIRFILKSRGFSDEEMDARPVSSWFKPNRFNVTLRVTRGELIELDGKFTEADNKVIQETKMFNGEALKYNTIEEPSKWKPHNFQAPEVWFAMSTTRHKGLSTLGKPKKKSNSYVNDNFTFEIINDLGEAVFDQKICVESIVRKRIKHTDKKSLYESMKGKYSNISNKKLKEIIWRAH